MRYILVLVLIALACPVLQAQTDKTAIAVFPFGATQVDRGRAMQIHDMVIEVLRAKSNIELIDRSTDSLLVKELDLQIREQSMAAGGLVQQGKVIGAKNMITGAVTNLTVEQKTGGGTYNAVQYTANLNFSLQLIDVESGRVISARNFNNREGSRISFASLLGASSPSKDEAITQAVQAAKKLVMAWINESYPPEIKIVNIEERDSHGFPKTILVSGIDGSLQRGSQLTINETVTVPVDGGKSLQRVKKVAELRVTEIQGDITVCRVTDGERDIEEKIKSGAKLHCHIR